MIQDHKVVVVIPAGRRRYMKTLLRHIMKEIDIIDEVRFWVNTSVKEDIEWMEEKAKSHEKITTEYGGDPRDGSFNIHVFFPNCTEENTVYIRLDDDVVWLQEKFIENLAIARIENPEYFLVFPNIINSAFLDHFNQKDGFYRPMNPRLGKITRECFCPVGWKDGSVAERRHDWFLKTYIESKKPLPELDWIEVSWNRISINCISWLGQEFKKFNGEVGQDEEAWLTLIYPEEKKLKNLVARDIFCSHFSFYMQRDHMDKTNILERYENI